MLLNLSVRFGDVAQQAPNIETAEGAMGNYMSLLCSVTLIILQNTSSCPHDLLFTVKVDGKKTDAFFVADDIQEYHLKNAIVLLFVCFF